MIALDLKQEIPATATPTASSLKQLKTDKEILSFSDLLQGIKEGDKIEKETIILALDDTKEDKETNNKIIKNDLLSRLVVQNEKSLQKNQDTIEINPQVKSSLTSIKEFKQLIRDAKVYLKDKIINSEGFQHTEIEKLPKTLKGLVEVAKKIGIDLSEVTLEEVRQQGRVPITGEKELKSSIAVNMKKSHFQAIPLFKLQKQREISTQQFVSAKTQRTPDNMITTQGRKSDATLKQLLQKGDIKANEDFLEINPQVKSSLTSIKEFKQLIRDAKVYILLKGEKSDESTASHKMEGLHIAKAESFEIKLNEAKQMIKYLSQDVKQAIDNYKAPFTRVKLQLNPQKLGEVDVTIVQRGKNLHVNLSSNNTAINTLALNANDLKVQLQNNGIQNASLNFNNNSQSSEFANGGQAQQQQQRQNAQHEYNYFENEETNEEIVSSLEIVVPHYA
ncbi:Flagellar hook-length control protein FliK [hydrothermal vent metagenome]|uniref:Flagellar hook-length control protein FliK n=1 Tax=hydrothermal vent metagenome TaxID=652676 RepID=A0A1W1BZ07_9ZZZZ